MAVVGGRLSSVDCRSLLLVSPSESVGPSNLILPWFGVKGSGLT